MKRQWIPTLLALALLGAVSGQAQAGSFGFGIGININFSFGFSKSGCHSGSCGPMGYGMPYGAPMGGMPYGAPMMGNMMPMGGYPIPPGLQPGVYRPDLGGLAFTGTPKNMGGIPVLVANPNPMLAAYYNAYASYYRNQGYFAQAQPNYYQTTANNCSQGYGPVACGW